MVNCVWNLPSGAIKSSLKAAFADANHSFDIHRTDRRNQPDKIKMFCETTLWSMERSVHLQTTRDPICLVEISSGRSVSIEDTSGEGEGWISEYQTPSKQNHRITIKPQTTAKSRIFLSSKLWTFLQFKTSTPA